MKIKNYAFSLTLLLLFLCIVPVEAQKEQGNDNKRVQIENAVKRLLDEFLINEDMEALGALLHDSLDFVWPSTHHFDKTTLIGMCTRLINNHDNKVEIIDIVIEDNTAFVLFVWSGVISADENPAVVGKEFAIHDCYRLVWEDGKFTEWYTI